MQRVRELWVRDVWVRNTVYVLLVLAGGELVMAHETLQTRYTLKESTPGSWSASSPPTRRYPFARRQSDWPTPYWLR